MAKTTKITLLATLLSVVVMVAGAAYVAAGKEAVTITEEVLVGDVSSVEGRTLNFETKMGDNHFWEVSVPLGQVEGTQVTYEYFSAAQNREVGEFILNMDIMRAFWVSYYDVSTTEELDRYFLGEASADVASRAEVGEYYTETILYSDYYEYYPIDIVELLPSLDSAVTYGYLSEEALEQLEETVQLPVVEGDSVDITVYIGQDGVVNLEGTATDDALGAVQITAGALSVVEEDGIYFSVQLQQEEPLLDREVYYASLVPSQDNFNWEIEEIKHLATIPKSIEMMDMADGGDVLVGLIVEEEETYLATYSKSDITELDRVLLPQGGTRIEMMGDAAYIPKGNVFTVVSIEDERCSVVMEHEFADVSVDSEWTMYESGGTCSYIDGELFLTYSSEWGSGMITDMMVCCYDTEGLVYAGLYHNSQKNEVFVDEEYENWMGYSRGGVVY